MEARERWVIAIRTVPIGRTVGGLTDTHDRRCGKARQARRRPNPPIAPQPHQHSRPHFKIGRGIAWQGDGPIDGDVLVSAMTTMRKKFAAMGLATTNLDVRA